MCMTGAKGSEEVVEMLPYSDASSLLDLDILKMISTCECYSLGW